MKATLLNIFLGFIFFSCGHLDNKENNSSILNSDSKLSRLDRWLSFYNLQLEDFTDSLPLVERKTIDSEYDLKSDTENLFKDFFIYSPDSANCIDLDSYSVILEKDSIGHLVSSGNEVDNETAMIDIKGKKRIRILFCGTDCRFEEAYWKRNNFVYILGFTKNNISYYPTIWTFEINNHFFQEIKSKKPINLLSKDYIKEVRLKLIKFI